MATRDDEVLGLVWLLDEVLDRYLSGAAPACDAASQILEACEQMRAMEPSEGAKYWLGAIEHHAAEIANPRERMGEHAPFIASTGFLGIQLLNDIYYLRTQLMSPGNTAH